jgi:hypothetical protein
MIPTERTYPVFEANQVLTNRHLNDLFEFLDEQNRLTRTNLIGIGVVCGLEFSVAADGTNITLNKGCGVTSAGYLAVVPDDPTTKTPDSIVLETWKVYKTPADVAYPTFYRADGSQYDLWELFPDGEPDSTALFPGFLQDKVLLLFVECNRENLKTCSPNSCDDKGQEVTVTLRKLLIFRKDLDEIIAKANSGAANPGLQVNLQLGLPDLRLRRFDVEYSGVDNAAEIFTAYHEILLEPQGGAPSLFQAVGRALSKAYHAFQPLVMADEATDPFTDHLAAVQSSFVTNYFTNSIIFTQYYYDFMGDLIAAYDEFRYKGLKLMALCCPSADLFPRHLMLGELQGSGRKLYRHYFQASSAQLAQAALAAEVRQLFRRLVAMVRNFALPTFPMRGTPLNLVRITPSRYGPDLLSQKAIPFYFRVNNGLPALFEQWSFEKTSTERATHNLSYHAEDYPSPDFARNPLRYDIEPNNFFRIEGGIGLPWRDVAKDVLDKIRRFRLPFDVIALNADDFAVSKNPLPGHCIDNDLDVIYKAWLKEAECLFKKKVGFFSSFNLAEGRFTRLAALSDESQPTIGGREVKGPGLTAVSNLAMFGGSSLSAMRFFPINDAVVTSGGSIGEALKPKLDEQVSGGVSAADLVVNVNNALKDNEKVLTMNRQDYSVVVEAPTLLIGAVAELTDAIPDESEELDIDLALTKYNGLKLAASRYLNDLVLLPPSNVFIPPTERDKAVEELKGLLDNCLDQRLKELAVEIKRRRQLAAETIFFSNYVKKHPDIQHKAGVTVGGTFVLVFRETPNTPTPTGNVVTATDLRANLAVNTNATVLGREAKEVTATASSFLNIDKKKLNNLQAEMLSSAFVNAGLQFDFGNLVDAGVFEINPEILTPRPKQLQIPEGVVIADFFLPYRCCSDCPPVQFVLPPPRPAFTVSTTCPTPNGAEATINIVAGEQPFEVKIGEGENVPFVSLDPLKPIFLPIGKTVLVVRDSQGGESMPVTVEIAPPLQFISDPKGFEAECSQSGESFNLTILIAGGKAPFFVNGQPPLSVVEAAGGVQVLAGPFPSGTPLMIEVVDSSGCPGQSFAFEHSCRPTPPTATNDATDTAFNTPVNINVLGNDTGTNLKVIVPPQQMEGTATVNANNSITFTPSANISGRSVSFTYRVEDSAGQTAQATVTVRVGARRCDLPHGGDAQRCRYPMWLSKPNGKMSYRFTEVANLTIFDEKGNLIFQNSLVPIFDVVLKSGSSLTATNFNPLFKQLFKSINKLVADNLGQNFFILDSTEFTHGGLLAVEKFDGHRFILDVMYGVTIDNTNVQAQWVYDENAVSVQQQEPAQAGYKVGKFGCDIINKCVQPEKREPAGRVKITEIKATGGQNPRLTAITEPDLGDNARYDWLLEWSKEPFMTGQKIQPSILANPAKARLIVVDRKGNWDYFELSGNIGSSGTGGSTGGGTGGGTTFPTGPTRPGGLVINRPGISILTGGGGRKATTKATDKAANTPPTTKAAKAPAKKAASPTKKAADKPAAKPKATSPAKPKSGNKK